MVAKEDDPFLLGRFISQGLCLLNFGRVPSYKVLYLIHPQVAVSNPRNRTRTPGPPPLLAAASLRICLRMGGEIWLKNRVVFWLKKGWKVRDDTRILPSRYIQLHEFQILKSSCLFWFFSYQLISFVRSRPFLIAMAEAASVGRYLLVRWPRPKLLDMPSKGGT